MNLPDVETTAFEEMRLQTSLALEREHWLCPTELRKDSREFDQWSRRMTHVTLALVSRMLSSQPKDVVTELADEVKVHYPEDWWQALKERWFPEWALVRWPVRYREHVIPTSIKNVRTTRVCPHVEFDPSTHSHVHLFWLRDGREPYICESCLKRISREWSFVRKPSNPDFGDKL
jgi:hypothetical protein